MAIVLGWVAQSVISSGVEAFVGQIPESDQYVGSYYTGTVYNQNLGRYVNVDFFQSNDGNWFGYFTDNRWRIVNPPSVELVRTANVYRKSSGQLYWTNP